MELNFSELSKKEVINIGDGRSLGRVCDLVFNYPEGMIFGIVVPGRRGLRFFKFRCNDMFIDLCHVKKIGDDVVLVDLRLTDRPKRCKPDRDCPPPRPPKDNDDEPPHGRIDMRDYE